MIATLWPVAALSALVTWLVRRWGRHHLLDLPTARSSHSQPTPRGGGLGIVVGIVFGLRWTHDPPAIIVSGLILLIAAVSFWDDVRPLPALLRLGVHAVVACGAVFFFGHLPFPGVPADPWGGAHLVVVPLTVVWVVGLTNAYNFMDGIDGMAGLQGVIGGAAWWLVGSQAGSPLVTWVGALTALACSGFLLFNWAPASIFMGDVGSASLGGLFALLPLVAASGANPIPSAALVGILIVWPFLVDTTWTMWRRARRGERLLDAHRSHLYQRMVLAGYTHQRVTLLYGGCALISSGAAIAGQRGYGWLAAGGAGLIAVGLIGLTNKLEQRHRHLSPEAVARRRD